MSSRATRHAVDAVLPTGRADDEPLASCPVDEQRVLLRAEGDLRMRRRLAALGLRRGAPVTLMMRTSGGGAVVSVAGARIALDRSMLSSLHTVSAEAVA
ncbi:MAG: FeoA family protein [Acidipropionibacterium acidipropionici]|jgi:ferrous iron transport protein A|uniref:FeoA family protein n=1 Tax=Acidipropionibacterium acidipropionici TaxID=1748 RepID=UPI0009DAB9F2|nr:FeoA family protein [Acidipropionibacterium acidipropionici]AZP37536.1 ferrous iron transport protein A [Acidipropionibacterium acidipropionici]MDN6556965.1 ferrous iron transport protein A [Acidipropionibacterium acidipropionici]QCV94581.1 ferrous iron transport protein A [Acidipropionibacterium acidipropionici]